MMERTKALDLRFDETAMKLESRVEKDTLKCMDCHVRDIFYKSYSRRTCFRLNKSSIRL